MTDERIKKSAGENRVGRAMTDRAVTENREVTENERIEMFRQQFFQSSLPDLPKIPGWHCCWRALMVAPVLFMLWWEMGGAPGEVVRQGEASGVVTAVHKHAYLISLDDGGEVRVFRTRKLDKGARVTLHVSQFESGVTQYVLPGADSAPP